LPTCRRGSEVFPTTVARAPHWGYVTRWEGDLQDRRGDETFEAGDAYYVGPGHTPVLSSGTELVEFSPTEELQQTIDVVTKNMQAAD
jgi:hypothetical protein